MATASLSLHVTKITDVMDEVYGPFSTDSSTAWKPKPYADNKSRYLWTDAFGVCNYLTLYLETGEQRFLQQAKALIEDVHNVLGKDRAGVSRLGDSTDDHPLRGGLRIGKKDEEGHPDGDGQYFHYLTKWMFALNRMSLVTSDLKYNRWAIELIKAIHPSFVRPSPTRGSKKGMVWKVSIDRSRAVVPHPGNLDPFDGYVTYRVVQSLAEDPSVLNSEIEELKQFVMAKYSKYSSDDPLDLGEALWIAHFFVEEDWAKYVKSVSLASLEFLWRAGYFQQPTSHRLAFREFGTTISLQVTTDTPKEWHSRVQHIHEVWAPKIWKRDRDITPVMYCTSLLPGVFDRQYLEQKGKTSIL
jgi:hypothetical protein